MNTIKYKDLKAWYLNNDTACMNADIYFKGKPQPSIFKTGSYSAPSWSWGYQIGIVGVNGSGRAGGNNVQSGTVKWFEVVTQFGQVKAAREIHLPLLQEVEMLEFVRQNVPF